MSEPNWLSKWRDIAKAATPGPWEFQANTLLGPPIEYDDNTGSAYLGKIDSKHDGGHIASASPDRVLGLLALVEEIASAMRESLSRSEDVADSWCSKPLRECLKKYSAGPGAEGPL